MTENNAIKKITYTHRKGGGKYADDKDTKELKTDTARKENTIKKENTTEIKKSSGS